MLKVSHKSVPNHKDTKTQTKLCALVSLWLRTLFNAQELDVKL